MRPGPAPTGAAATWKAVPSSRGSFLALLLCTAPLLGCPRAVSVHVSAAELSRARPEIAIRKKGLTLATTSCESLDFFGLTQERWAGDDGSRADLLNYGPYATSPFRRPDPLLPPRGGTWTFTIPDTTTASRVGKMTTIVGGIATGTVLLAMFLTAGFSGPEPSYDPYEVLHVESLLLIPSAGLATAGALIWAGGNLHYRLQPSNLGEGIFRW